MFWQLIGIDNPFLKASEIAKYFLQLTKWEWKLFSMSTFTFLVDKVRRKTLEWNDDYFPSGLTIFTLFHMHTVSESRSQAWLNLGLRVYFPGRRPWPRPPAKQGSYSSVSENSITFLTGAFYLKKPVKGKILSQCPFDIWIGHADVWTRAANILPMYISKPHTYTKKSFLCVSKIF